MKGFLKKTIANSLLTFEELNSILVQVEGMLNSRPLCPLSSDPSDATSLTPAHLILGRALQTVPEWNVSDVKESRLSMHQHLEAIRQQIWKQWSLHYISELQVRQKWRTHSPNVQLGSLVMMKDKNAPPLNRPLARIIKLHPGSDGVVRTVTLKTSRGETRRGVHLTCLLPTQQL